MQALMMDAPLTLDVLTRRFEEVFPTRPIVSRRNDRVVERSTWGEVGTRARRLSAALAALGVQPGDRVATLAWNTRRHLEAYFGIPGCGGVLHTLNLRLHPRELEYIIGHAGDAVILVDECLLPLLDRVSPSIRDTRFVVMRETDAPMPPGALDYEDLIAGADADPGRRRCWTSNILPRCATRRGRRARRKASCIRTARRCFTRWAWHCLIARGSRNTMCVCQSCRCSTSMRGAFRSPRHSWVPGSSFRDRTWIRSACSTSFNPKA